MLEDINGTVDGVREIAGGAETCVSSNDIVSDTMSSLSAISEENAASSETTGASVQELSATVSSLANSADDLKDIAVSTILADGTDNFVQIDTHKFVMPIDYNGMI